MLHVILRGRVVQRIHPVKRCHAGQSLTIGITFVPALGATAAAARAEANTLTCVLERSGSECSGTCEVPCSVDALGIDVDGPNPKKAGDSLPKTVHAALHETSGGNWLGTTQLVVCGRAKPA